MPDTELLTQLIDLKIERAASALLAELQKLADAHNHLAQAVVPPLVADLEKRTRDLERAEAAARDNEAAVLRDECRALHDEIARLKEGTG